MNDRSRRTPGDTPPDPMDPWLRGTVASERGAVPSECLDPEVLAAWAEGALSASERSFAEAHAARCARCQAMLAVMARTVPPEQPAARSPFRKWFMMLTPAAAATIAVALWFAVDDIPRQRQAQPVPASAPESMIARDERAAATPPATVTPPPASEDKKTVLPDSGALRSNRETERADANRTSAKPNVVSERRRAALVDELKKLEAQPQKEKDAAAPGGLAEAVTVVAESPTAQTSQQRPQTSEETRQLFRSAQQREAQLPSPQQNAQQNAQPNTQSNAPQNAAAMPARAAAAPGSPPPPPAAAPTKPAADADATSRVGRSEDFFTGSRVSGAGGRGATAANELALKVRLAPVTVAAPDGKTQWRIADRLVQQSIDGGTVWSTHYTVDEKTLLVAGAAPSPTVCWLVGRSGAIVATSDGVTWRRVAFPISVDLVAVTSTDARNATVVAADKRVFVTTDGGARWMAK